MTKEQAKDFVSKHKDAVSFVKPSHLEELSPLVEVHIEAIIVRKDEFHDLSGSYSPKKETLDKFAQAAGVAYNTINEATRKEGDDCYIGRSQAMIMGPDGKWNTGDVCEYEFDVDVRTEEAVLNGKPDWEHKVNGRPGRREYTELEIKQERLQMKKVARQRANTGARNRATLSVLGMQTGFKGLFSKDSPDSAAREFLFSRIIVNSKNEMVAKAMLANLTGNQSALFGGQSVPVSAQLAAPEYQGDTIQAAHEIVVDDFSGASDAFDGPAATQAPRDDDGQGDPRDPYLQALRDWRMRNDFSPEATKQIDSALGNPHIDLEALKKICSKCDDAVKSGRAPRKGSVA